jgi:hypothetical protein
VFETVTDWAVLAEPTAVDAKERDDGDAVKVAVPVPLVPPVPVSDTVAVPLPALLATDSVPVRVPDAVGRNVT